VCRMYVTPRVLRWVRESRICIGLEFAAWKVGVSVSTLESWECGDSYPTYVELKRLVDVYCTAMGIFYLPEPPDYSLPILLDHRLLGVGDDDA